MRTWLVIVIAGAAACRDAKLAQLERVKAEVCACKTTACVDAALQTLPPPAGEPDRRARQLAHDLLDCVARISTAAPPPEAPPAATDAGTATPTAP